MLIDKKGLVKVLDLGLARLEDDLRAERPAPASPGRLTVSDQMLGTAEFAWTLSPLRRWDFWRLSFRLGLEFAVFGDVGLAWNEAREFAMNNTRSGVGTGLRLLIPGSEMVRFDVGWSSRDGFHFHFAANSKAAAQRNRLR